MMSLSERSSSLHIGSDGSGGYGDGSKDVKVVAVVAIGLGGRVHEENVGILALWQTSDRSTRDA